MIVARPPKDAGPASHRAGPGVPRTGFNFVEDAYQQRRRERRNNKVVIGASVAVWSVLGWLGWSSSTASSHNRLEVAAATQKVAVVNQQLGQELGGVTDLPGHMKARRDEIDAALSVDMDTTSLIADLFATAPPDLRLVSVSVRAPDAPHDQLTQATTTTTTTAVGSPDAAEKARAGAVLSVQAEGTTYATATAWRDAALGLPYLRGVSVDYTEDDEGGTIQLSLVAMVDMSVLQRRRFATAAELGFTPAGAPPEASSTTTVPVSVPGGG